MLGLSKKYLFIVSNPHMWGFETIKPLYLLARGCPNVLFGQPQCSCTETYLPTYLWMGHSGGSTGYDKTNQTEEVERVK